MKKKKKIQTKLMEPLLKFQTIDMNDVDLQM